jgi:hypothetical protein
MSMSMHVIGFVPPDGTWAQMKAIWDACQAAGVSLPDEVEDFFGGEPKVRRHTALWAELFYGFK